MRKFLSVFFLGILFLLPVNSAFALLVTSPGGVLMVDGEDAGNTVGGISFNITAGAGLDFGFVDSFGDFQTIIASGSTVGNWTFNAGDIIDFALRNGGGSIFSISDPIDYADKDFQQIVGANVHTPNVTPYFNTLSIDWDETKIGGGLIVAASILDAGPAFDGVAPVPLPPAVLLFGTGLIGLIGIARRSFFVS